MAEISERRMARLQEITFQVPVQFRLPGFYEDQTPERVALALRIGAQAVEDLFSSISETIREECNAELVVQLEKKHLKKQEQLERERKVLEENLEHLRGKIHLDEALSGDMRRQLMEEARAMYKEILDEKDKRIHHLQDQLSAEVRNLHEKFQTVRDGINRQLGSQEKGRQGEVSMEDLIKKAFGMVENFDLQAVGKEAQKGDHLMRYKAMRVMWEIKNYTRMVSKEEVEKLHRDMRSNPEVGLALMVALQTGIVGHSKAGDIDLEVLEDGRFIVYVNNLYKREDPILYLQALKPILDIVEARKEKGQPLESGEVENLRFKAKIVHHLLLTHQKTLAALHNSIVQQKKKIDQTHTELLAHIRAAESECGSAIREILSEGAEADKGSLEVLNPEIFTKAAYADLNKTQKVFVEWLREKCIEDVEGEIESKRFLELLKPKLKTEKEVKEAREVFQDSVWPKGGKKIKGLRLRD